MQSCYCDLRRSQRVEQLCVEWQAIEKCGETFWRNTHEQTVGRTKIRIYWRKFIPFHSFGQFLFSSSSLSAIRVETCPSGIESDSAVPWDVHIQRYPFTLAHIQSTIFIAVLRRRHLICQNETKSQANRIWVSESGNLILFELPWIVKERRTCNAPIGFLCK